MYIITCLVDTNMFSRNVGSKFYYSEETLRPKKININFRNT